MNSLLSSQILKYYSSIEQQWSLPKGVELIYPFNQPDTLAAMKSFYQRFYQDTNKRKLILGINPGRLGAGVTGIPFTDPIHLERVCKIPNEFHKRHELSSIYVFDLIEAYGGPKAFFSDFYISSTCPLGFTKEGINYNYYDDKALFTKVEKYIVRYMELQLKMNIDPTVVFCWGKGKNYKFLKKLNDKHEWFEKIVPQPHPRWIMQYRRKTKDDWLQQMLEDFTS